VSRTPVTTSSAGSRTAVTAPPPPGGRGTSRGVTWVIVVASLVALGLRLYELFRPGYLSGVSEYDDGTDFGSAVRLIHGGIPYRDFVMVQPPGITLLMSPVALATQSAGTAVGMTVARIVTAVAGAAAVPLGGLLVRHRGLTAVLVTCGTLAIFPDSLLAARTVLLEPWLVLFCVLGALAVFDRDQFAGSRRLFLGGLAFGFAGAVKVWAIVPVLVILAMLIRRRREALRYAAGVVAGFAVPVLPFALSAPATFYRSVVIAQLVRSDLRVPEGYRLQQLIGLAHTQQLGTPILIVIGAAVVVAIAVAEVLASRLAGAPPPLEVFALGSFALVVAAFLWPADFYYHYAAFFTPFVALAIALPVSRLLDALPAGKGRPAAGAAASPGSPRVPHDAGQAGPAADLPPPATPPEPSLVEPSLVEPDLVGTSLVEPDLVGTSPAGGGRAETAAPGAPRRAGLLRRHATLVQRTALAVAAVALLVLTGLQTAAEAQEASQVPADEITQAARLIPPGACVGTDQVSYTIAINRFVASKPGCSLMVDGVGTDYAYSGHNGLAKEAATPTVEAAWMDEFRTAQYLWLTSQVDKRIPWTPALLVYLHEHFKPLTDGPDFVYVRTNNPAG
jgi:glycosyl transferase family 87